MHVLKPGSGTKIINVIYGTSTGTLNVRTCICIGHWSSSLIVSFFTAHAAQPRTQAFPCFSTFHAKNWEGLIDLVM